MIRIFVFSLILLSTIDLFGETGDSVNIHGFISQGYLKSTRNDFIQDSTDGTWQFNEFGINFGHHPIEKLLISLQLFARDLGSVGNDQVSVDLAFADYRFRDFLGIRAGKMKSPMGLYSETRDVDMLRTCTFLPLSVYDELLKDSQNYTQGIGIYGFYNRPWGSIGYQALLGTCNIDKDSATADFLELGLSNISAVKEDTTQTYALQYSDPAGFLRIGATACFTALHVDAVTRDHIFWFIYHLPEGVSFNYDVNNIEIYTASAELTLRNLVLTYETKYTKARNLILFNDNQEFYNRHLDQYGYYGMITYRFTNYFEAGVYYEEFFPYKNDRHGHQPEFGFQKEDHWLKKWAFSLKFDINPNWLLKLETQYVDGTAYLIYEENISPRHHWFINAAKLTYNF